MPFNWTRFRKAADDAEKKSVFRERVDQVEAATAHIRERLLTIGAMNLVSTWLAPAVEATVTAEDVPEILTWPGVSDVVKGEVTIRPLTEYTDAYSGLESRAAMRTSAFITAGLKGQAGGGAGGNVRVGLIERFWDGERGHADHMDWKHRGFIDCTGPGCAYRLGAIDYCIGGTCTPQTNPANSELGGPTHANLVLQIMAGSIETGSDGTVTDTNGRVRRSGIAPLATPYHYEHDDPCSSIVAAIQRAITDDLDILDLSESVGTCLCGATCNECGLNTFLYNLQSAGVLLVTSLGNEFDDAQHNCNVVYPAMRREGLSVAQIDSTPQSVSYETAGIRAQSSRGGMDLQVYAYGLAPRAVALADLAAPGCWTYQYYNLPSNGYAGLGQNPLMNWGCGTSYAAPAVAGAAALMRQALVAKGWIVSGQDDVGTLMVNMLLMGDGYSYDQGGFRATGFDQRSGAGRVHMHYPNSANLTGPWGWGTHAISLTATQQATFWVGSPGPESPSITQWKLAMTWVENNYTAASDIVVEVRDTCAGTLVASDYSFDMRKRITLTQSQISNKCLAYTVKALSTRPGVYPRIYVADYFHSGSPADH